MNRANGRDESGLLKVRTRWVRIPPSPLGSDPILTLMKKWSVYMLLCSDGSLYTGITTDVDRRVREHNSGKGSKYVRSRRPAELVWREDAKSRSEALRREAAIKALSKADKERLVEGM